MLKYCKVREKSCFLTWFLTVSKFARSCPTISILGGASGRPIVESWLSADTDTIGQKPIPSADIVKRGWTLWSMGRHICSIWAVYKWTLRDSGGLNKGSHMVPMDPHKFWLYAKKIRENANFLFFGHKKAHFSGPNRPKWPYFWHKNRGSIRQVSSYRSKTFWDTLE